MTWIIRRMLVVAVASTLAGTAAAQTTGTTTGTTGSSSSSSFSGSTNGSSNSGGSGFTNGQEGAPSITGGMTSGGVTNRFSGYYANPFYQGLGTGNNAPGGFGTALSSSGGGGGSGGTTGANRASTGSGASGRSTGSTGSTGMSTGTTGSYGSTGTSTGSRTGSTGSTGTSSYGGLGGGVGGSSFGGTTGTTNRSMGSTGGLGGTSRGTGAYGSSNNQQQAGVIVQQPTPIRYSVSVRFPTPVIVPAKMQGDLRASLDRSTFITSPANVSIAMEGPVVVLRGRVKDEEEARTAEGIIRLTPGVREVKNELEFPKE